MYIAWWAHFQKIHSELRASVSVRRNDVYRSSHVFIWEIGFSSSLPPIQSNPIPSSRNRILHIHELHLDSRTAASWWRLRRRRLRRRQQPNKSQKIIHNHTVIVWMHTVKAKVSSFVIQLYYIVNCNLMLLNSFVCINSNTMIVVTLLYRSVHCVLPTLPTEINKRVVSVRAFVSHCIYSVVSACWVWLRWFIQTPIIYNCKFFMK